MRCAVYTLFDFNLVVLPSVFKIPSILLLQFSNQAVVVVVDHCSFRCIGAFRSDFG